MFFIICLIIGCIVGIKAFCYIESRQIIIRFFNWYDEIKKTYEMAMLLENGEYDYRKSGLTQEEFQIFIEKFSVKYHNDLKLFIEATIDYYNMYLKDLQNEEIDSRAENLMEFGTDVRRWLWNNSADTK